MKANGNGTPSVCAENLLKMFMGECPYERVKGMNPRTFDKPYTTAVEEIREGVEWVLENYEPRISVNIIAVGSSESGKLSPIVGANADGSYNVSIS